MSPSSKLKVVLLVGTIVVALALIVVFRYPPDELVAHTDGRAFD